MPNHVHVVFAPSGGHRLSAILQSWKSFTAKEINSSLKKSGTVWERESFDHLIRTPEHFDRFVRYIINNPVDAGYCGRPEEWPFSNNCCAGFLPACIDFVNPRETPFAQGRNRGELPHLEKEGGSYFVTFRLADAVISKMSVQGGRPEACTTIKRTADVQYTFSQLRRQAGGLLSS